MSRGASTSGHVFDVPDDIWRLLLQKSKSLRTLGTMSSVNKQSNRVALTLLSEVYQSTLDLYARIVKCMRIGLSDDEPVIDLSDLVESTSKYELLTAFDISQICEFLEKQYNLIPDVAGYRDTLLAHLIFFLQSEWCIFKKLDLFALNIGDKGADAIAGALRFNDVLKNLVLCYNEIGDEGAKAIGGALAVNGGLTELDLHYNDIDDEGVEALASALLSNEVLTKLNLSYNEIGDKGYVAIAEALRGNNVLTSLDVSRNNDLREEAALSIVRVERDRNKLTSLNLDLGHIRLTKDGADELADYVLKSGVLTELVLVDNSMGDVGAVALASALRDNVVLTTLSLWNDDIGNEGAAALASALRYNEVLQHLHLDINNIDDEGAKKLASALPVNRVLMSLGLTDNRFSDEGVKLIEDAVNVRTGFTLRI